MAGQGRGEVVAHGEMVMLHHGVVGFVAQFLAVLLQYRLQFGVLEGIDSFGHRVGIREVLAQAIGIFENRGLPMLETVFFVNVDGGIDDMPAQLIEIRVNVSETFDFAGDDTAHVELLVFGDKRKHRLRDSNPGPPDPQSGALAN